MPACRLVAYLLALFLSASAPAAAPGSTEWRMRAPAAPRGDALLRRAMLDGHNRTRAELGLPPLLWSERLARAAGEYARVMARSGRFAHARQPSATRQGENLFAGTRDVYGYDDMVRLWIDERRNAVDRPSSQPRRWQDVGHYAQIVWRDTRAVGCGLASGRNEDFLVCRYATDGEAPEPRPH